MLITGRVAQMGRGVMQDVARRMIGQMAQNMEALLSGGAQAEHDDAVSAGSLLGSVVADRAQAHLPLRASRRGALAALAGYALLSRGAVRPRCAARRRGQRRRLLRLRPGQLRVVAGLVAARDRARPPPAADRSRLRTGRLEPRLDERHPGPGAAGLAADRALRAGARLRRARAGRAGAGGLVRLPALPRVAHGHVGGPGRRPGLRLRELRGHRDAQPPQPRARLHAPAGRARGRALPARRPLRSPVRGAVRALRARRLRDVPGDALLGHARRRVRVRRRPRVHARRRARADLPLPAARQPGLRHRAAGGGAVPLGGARASRSRSASAGGATSSTSPT